MEGLIQIIDEKNDDSENNIPTSKENMFYNLGCKNTSKSSIRESTMTELPENFLSKEEVLMKNQFQYF